MMRRIGPSLLLAAVLYGSCALAQTDTGASPDESSPATQPGPKPAFTYPDAAPSLDFLTSSIENSSIMLGISTGFAYDSNGYPNTVGNATTNDRWLYDVAPSVRIQQFLPKLVWHAGYSGGLQIYDQVNGRSNGNSNLYSQSATGGFLWQLAKHWQLGGNESYRYSANPFDSYLTIPGTPTANNPNPVSYYPLTNFTQNNADISLTYQLSKQDTLAFTGTETYRDTSTYNLVTAVPFYNLTSYGGRASYSHQLSPRFSLGAGYDFNSLDFGTGQQRSGIQTISFTTSYLIRPNMTISVWIGPEYTSTKTVVPFFGVFHDSLWSTSVGADFGWRSARNSVHVGFVRRVSDGGGLIATSQVNSVTGTYRRLLAYKLSALVGGRWMRDTSTTVQSRSFDNYALNTGATYQIAKSLNATVDYSHIHQNQSNVFLIGQSIYSDNRVGATISYEWSHPLGR